VFFSLKKRGVKFTLKEVINIVDINNGIEEDDIYISISIPAPNLEAINKLLTNKSINEKKFIPLILTIDFVNTNLKF
jgi:hypothetical protein